jgi:hypothetical protein
MSTNAVVDETPGFFERIREFFHKEEVVEAPTYHRKLLDGRIERYLDENFQDYIAEYNLVTETDINAYEARFEVLSVNVGGLSEFTKDIEAKVSDLERRVKKINSTASSKGKKSVSIKK